jgi:SAM-dependent methyltransferase
MTTPFICLKCKGTKLTESFSSITCDICSESYPKREGVYDFLFEPTNDVVKELTGMAIENGFAKEDYLKFKINRLRPRTLDEKLESTKNDYNQYYQQTLMNFTQAFYVIRSRYDFKKARVLEIGSCFDYYFLKPFLDLGSTCYGLNLYFNIDEQEKFTNFPIKVLGDMNRIPFKNDFFDVVLISATSHHSNTPEVLLKEITRILKPGGASLIINDPIMGKLKVMGSKMIQGRHDHINENEYTLSRYNTMFKSNNLEAHHLFSAYHDQKLLKGGIHRDVRFSTIATIVSALWNVGAVRQFLKRFALPFAQSIFGFPMNVILYKKKSL